MKTCTQCVLPETFPGISFNDNGVCSQCAEFKGIESVNHEKEVFKERFEKLLAQHKGKNHYDALMCYSGGKDSTYTLIALKERYGLNILAITFDNGFIPEQTFKNIRNVVEKLGVDHLLFKARFDLLKRVFTACTTKNIYPAKTLERASTICTSCMGIVKFSTLRTALEKSVPFIAFGWSPGQAPITSSIMKNNPFLVRSMQDILLKPLTNVCGDEIRPYFLEEQHFSGAYTYPYNISPLAFLKYNEDDIYRAIAAYGWEAPMETDSNSTNCLLNSFANQVHRKQFDFHPYAFEMAKLVREGCLAREEALRKLSMREDDKTVRYVTERLGIDAGERPCEKCTVAEATNIREPLLLHP